MPKALKQLIAFIRDFLGLGPGQTDNSGWLHQSRTLAQTPSGATPARPPYGSYTSGATQPRPHKYSPEEVKRILRGLDHGEHAPLIMLQAATFGSLLDDRMIRYFRGRERLFERLPYVLFQYTQGLPAFDIARSVSFFSNGDDVEDAMEFAARLIALHVNRQR